MVGSNVWNTLAAALVIGSWTTTGLAVVIALASRVKTFGTAPGRGEKRWQAAALGIVITWIVLLVGVKLTGLEPGAGAFQGLAASVNGCI